MYPVSNAYKTALSNPAKVRRLTGYVGSVPFTDENISKGSFVIENSCSDGADITLGYAYMSSLTCVFRGINLDGEWYGKVITVSEGLLIDAENDTWEDVPLGIYTIQSADHREDGVYVTAYDNFLLLEQKYAVSTTTGTPYDYLAYISQKCGITLAQTEEEIRALPNGTQAFALYADNGIETYRELLFWVAQAVGCFCVITREGELLLKKYGGDPVDAVRPTDRWQGASFSDFTTKYTGISVVDIEGQSTHYKGLEVDDGLTYNLGSNPLMQNMSLDNVLGNLLNVLAEIQYTPFSADRAGAPAYDLGDCLSFPGGLGRGVVGCLMAYNYNYRGIYQMWGYGSNPALSTARNKMDKNIAGLMARANSEQFQYYTYTNARELEIRDDYKEIISIRFGSSKATLVVFQAEIHLESEIEEQDIDAVVGHIKYLWNNTELDYHPAETWIDGEHILHLMYLIPIQEAAINTFKVRLNCDGGVITVGRADLNAVISGQGLVASTEWDGLIEAEDNLGTIGFATEPTTVATFSETVTPRIITPVSVSAEDNLEPVTLENEAVVSGFQEIVYVNKKAVGTLTWQEVFNIEGGWQELYEDYLW